METLTYMFVFQKASKGSNSSPPLLIAISLKVQNNKEEQEFKLEDKDNKFKKKKEWTQVYFPHFWPFMEKSKSSGWIVEFSDPNEVNGHTTDQFYVSSGSGHRNDLSSRILASYSLLASTSFGFKVLEATVCLGELGDHLEMPFA